MYYCETTHAICGMPKNRMEGSVQIMLPSDPIIKWKSTIHPYRRTYSKKKQKAEWQINGNYCVEKVLPNRIFQSKLLLDLMDLSIFDFFTGNLDRHHYEKMITLTNSTFLIHIDNGRAFGKAFEDDLSILAPFTQCCLMRYSTYLRLKYLYINDFASILDKSLKSDPVYPILTPDHLNAVNRRLKIILNQLNICMDTFKPYEVLVDDGF